MNNNDYVTLTNTVNELHKQIEDEQRNVTRLLRCRYDWTTTTGIADSLRRCLTLARLWLTIRALFIDYTTKLGTLSDRCKEDIDPFTCFNSIRVGAYGSSWNRGKYAPRTISPTDLIPGFVDVKQLVELRTLIDNADCLAESLRTFYNQTTELWDDVPNYMDIKHLLPIGGRQALSVMMVVDRGTMSSTKPNENYLFGFCDDLARTARICRYAAKQLDESQVERKGKAPSWAMGCRTPEHTTPAMREPDNLCRRLQSFSRELPCVVGGDRRVHSPSLYLRAKREGYNKAVGIVSAIIGGIGYNNQIPTILLERPRRINDTDYEAQAVWEERTRDTRRPWTTHHLIKSGYVYFRQSWPECYHQEGEPLETQVAEETLEQNSRRYLNHLAQQRQCITQQKELVASRLRRLRQIPSIYIKDSYDAGNCPTGTREFITRLGLTGRCITGRQLARIWRKSGYYYPERFLPVVEAAEKRIETTVDEFYRWGMSNV